MKKLFFLSVLLSQISCTSQDMLDFNSQINPQSIYSKSTIQTSESEVKYYGDDEFLQRLKERGIQNPNITSKTTKSELVLNTGKITENNTFPVIVEFRNGTDTNIKKYLPEGSLIYGKCIPGKMPVLDSVSANGTNEEVKKQLIASMQNIFSQLSYPEKKLQIGDTFTNAMPLVIPIAGQIFDMNVITYYKLRSIHADVAILDITQTYTMRTSNSSDTSIDEYDPPRQT